MAPSNPNSSGLTKISDEGLLAAVHTCGDAGDVVHVRERLRARIGLDLDSSYLADCLNRLHRAGYVRLFQPHETDIPRYRLTEMGIERLDQTATEPSAAPTG